MLELLQLHSKASLGNLVGWEDTQVIRESEHPAEPDEPLRRIILVPKYSVPVVNGELVVEVVISFAHSEDCSYQVVSWSVDVIVGRRTKPVSHGV